MAARARAQQPLFFFFLSSSPSSFSSSSSSLGRLSAPLHSLLRIHLSPNKGPGHIMKRWWPPPTGCRLLGSEKQHSSLLQNHEALICCCTDVRRRQPRRKKKKTHHCFLTRKIIDSSPTVKRAANVVDEVFFTFSLGLCLPPGVTAYGCRAQRCSQFGVTSNSSVIS